MLGIRPEFIEISQTGGLDGEIYGAMPTGMESTIKIRVGDYLLTGVVFGSTLFRLGTKVRVKTAARTSCFRPPERRVHSSRSVGI